MHNKKIAIILFNIGGPDKAESVKGFLFNFFNDKAIINLPKFFRFFVAKLISNTRKNKSIKIYNYLGGGSPILQETKMQAVALEKTLANKNYKVFISMRYWHPMANETIKEVINFNPDQIILLPLYPQFSTTTTQSSIKNWFNTAKKNNFQKKSEVICCYYNNEDFIAAYTDLLKKTYELAKQKGTPRVLFSAHGLPESIIKAGDPYQWQIEQTAHSIIKLLGENNLDYVICYQSKVGPLKWIEPYTEDEIIKASKQNIPIVIIPIAFVSEHSETLVELDIEYKELALEYGNKNYYRVPAVRTHPKFIKCLADLCLSKINPNNYPNSKPKKCKSGLRKCYLQN